MSGFNTSAGCELPGVTCSAGGGSWWLFAIGMAVLIVALVRAVRRDR